jgi:hypothetical protein
LFVRGLLACAVAWWVPALQAQDPVRPWLDWRTLSTEQYRFHYPRELEAWTRHAAQRVEAVGAAITAQVGWPVPAPMDVVVDDPFRLANGYAVALIDKPVTVWWATPPDPRNDIGNFTTWGEMLSVHELTHIAHLTRPSRNPLQRALWASLPANVGPIALSAPRWLYEGYATVVEGRITGSGRPNHAWRPAILRQWAIEGHLPSYGQLAAWSDFYGGEFAYLGGSAFLEWLMQREGDSSLVHLWRRMSARQTRTFDASFRGVFGDAPALLYGLHTAQLTRDAMAAGAALRAAGLVEGELVQRLAWATGDPALSPNGDRVAITLRERDRPGRVVVWAAEPEREDTAAVRRRIDALKRDPQDVPDRRFYPLRKRALKTLEAANGRSYQMPRWFPDNRRVLLTRWTARSDATLSPALYEWDTETGNVRQVTPAVGVLQADPHPNSSEAVAMQCHWGHCDIAHVNLEDGVLRTLLEGTPDRTYYRPRFSPDGQRFVASVLDGGRWTIVLATAGGTLLPFAAPSDGANRYDPQWLGNDTLIVVSERGGIANLEKLAVASPNAVAVSRVTGAAMAPEVNRRDGSIWFLSMHSRGLDVRRLPRTARLADSVVTIGADGFGFAGVRSATPVTLAVNPTSAPRPYGVAGGPRHQRWLPGGVVSADGAGAFVSIYSGDIVGRLNAMATGAYGENGTWLGGSLRAVWRYPRPHLELGAHGTIHEPSMGRLGQPAADSVDGSLVHGVIALATERTGEALRVRMRLGGASGRLSPRDAVTQRRILGFGEVALRFQQSRGARGLVEQVRLHGTYGRTRGMFQRLLGTVEVGTTGRDMWPVQLRATAGQLRGEAHPFERFAIGGARTPVMDSSLLSQRHSMPALPTATAVGNSLLAWRAALPGVWTAFYEGASTAADLSSHREWHRAIGIERRYEIGHAPVGFLPRFEARGGAAYLLDAPFRKAARVFLEMRFDP